ncbi:gag/pol protein [Cucumis melo var. makuwa]|uniref:Gag/pol protein n=1 Tax=Cucumis melo var. makuwa TaxID=1194695 RepID=A0A5D3DKQ0_CUCMM|nr:gag/pol protein [Cucumis melo var. makuwa]TYK24195.1 gag/pol protein [Cucumis melo var. makuwa]
MFLEFTEDLDNSMGGLLLWMKIQENTKSRLLELEHYFHANGRILMLIASCTEKPISPHVVCFNQAIDVHFKKYATLKRHMQTHHTYWVPNEDLHYLCNHYMSLAFQHELAKQKEESVDRVELFRTHQPQWLRKPRRSERFANLPILYMSLTETLTVISDGNIEDPLTFKKAMEDVDKDEWIKAMNLELESILVAKGYTQVEGVDYEETFSHVAMKSIRILLSIAAYFDYEIWQMDVKTAFLNGNLEETIYMQQPEEFIIPGQEQKDKQTDFQTDRDSKKYTSEYVAACEAAKEVVWLKKFFTDLEVVPNMSKPITLYCDNSGTVVNSREPRSHKRGKHIERKYHLIREIVHRGDMIVTQIASTHNVADLFTKPLITKVFEDLETLGLRDMPHLI